MCTINEDQIIYGSWNIRCDRHKFLSFCTIFCPFRPLMTWKIKILKLKETTGDIILHMCNINDNHMMYDSWDMEHDEHNFLLFWTFFCPFTSLRARKIKILKTWKKIWRYYHFTQVYQKSSSYVILFLRCGGVFLSTLS